MVWSHISRMSQEKLPNQALSAKQMGKTSLVSSTIMDHKDLGWNRLEFHRSEMMDVTEDLEIKRGWLISSCIRSRNSSQKKRTMMRKRERLTVE